MSILALVLSFIGADPCKLGGLMGSEHDRSLAIYIADPDRQDICPVDQSDGPT